MKKFLAIFVLLFTFLVTLPMTAEAHNGDRCGRGKKRGHYSKEYRGNGYGNRGYYQTRGYNYQRPSFYRRHRNVINVGLATGGGALIGGLLGGNRRGMAAGALIGAGSGALYTYVLKPKKRRY
jgi:hypothetical protein